MGKTVLITGAVINTGYVVAEKFAQNGYNVIITSRGSQKAQESALKLSEKYPSVQVLGYGLNPLDSDNTVNQQDVIKMFDDFDKKGIVVDTLVLNAAHLGVDMKINENPLSDFVSVLNTNVVWNYAIIDCASARMKKNGGGNIIFINSNTAYRAIPNRIAYSTSKSAQLGMMRALALDLGKYNVRVNAVLPGMIFTDRWEKDYESYKKAPSAHTPLGFGPVDSCDIADACWYFAECAKNTTGAELVVDKGNSIQLYPIIEEN